MVYLLTLSLQGETNSKEIDTLGGTETNRIDVQGGFYVQWYYATELKLYSI